jgi:hypothetical protein
LRTPDVDVGKLFDIGPVTCGVFGSDVEVLPK